MRRVRAGANSALLAGLGAQPPAEGVGEAGLPKASALNELLQKRQVVFKEHSQVADAVFAQCQTFHSQA